MDLHPVVQSILSHPFVQACTNTVATNTVDPNSVVPNAVAANTVIANTIAAAGQDATLIGEVSMVKSLAYLIGPIIMLGLFGDYMVSGSVLPIYFAYGGLLMELIMAMVSSAYAITKIVDSAMQSNVFYYGYRGGSNIGDYLGMWELLNVLVFLTWSLVIWGIGWYIGFDLWTRFTELEKDKQMTQLEGFKYLLLGFITGAGIWVAGLNVGDMSSSMIGYFNSYNTKSGEATNSDGDSDTDGTAFIIDTGVHLTETYAVMTVVSSLVVYAIGTLYQWA